MYKKIDRLRGKFDKNLPLSFKEALFILWAEKHICSTQYFAFAFWCKNNNIKFSSKFNWKIWSAMFNGFIGSDEDRNQMNYHFHSLEDVYK